jgi:hypothetical protein
MASLPQICNDCNELGYYETYEFIDMCNFCADFEVKHRLRMEKTDATGMTESRDIWI